MIDAARRTYSRVQRPGLDPHRTLASRGSVGDRRVVRRRAMECEPGVGDVEGGWELCVPFRNVGWRLAECWNGALIISYFALFLSPVALFLSTCMRSSTHALFHTNKPLYEAPAGFQGVSGWWADRASTLGHFPVTGRYVRSAKSKLLAR